MFGLIFSHAVLFMDEVDVILHPLKSELNYPFGDKEPLQLSPIRWEVSDVAFGLQKFSSIIRNTQCACKERPRRQTITWYMILREQTDMRVRNRIRIVCRSMYVHRNIASDYMRIKTWHKKL